METIQEMVDFCARFGVVAKSDREDVEAAYDRCKEFAAVALETTESEKLDQDLEDIWNAVMAA